MGFVQEVTSVQNVAIDKIKSSMDEYSFACIRGLINVDDVNFAMENLRNRFSRKDDNPVIGEMPTDIHKNFQKLLVGGVSQTTNVHITRFFRVIYNPLWEEDIYHMHKLFCIIARLRNKIAGLPDNFALEKIEDNRLCLSRQAILSGKDYHRHGLYITFRAFYRFRQNANKLRQKSR